MTLLPIDSLKGVSAQIADKLSRLGISSVQDALFHLPFRYQDRTRITPIGALQLHADAVIEGEVRGCDITFGGRSGARGRRRSLVCRIQDGTGLLTLRFFHFSTAQKNQFKVGAKLRCYGEARRGSGGLEMAHPEYIFISNVADTKTINPEKISDRLSLKQELTPVYPTTDGITQPRLRNVILQALDTLNKYPVNQLLTPDLLPPTLRSAGDMTKILRWLHYPPANTNLNELQAGQHLFQKRLAFEELTCHHLSLLQLRQQLKTQEAWALNENASATQLFLKNLPFTLTTAQKKVYQQISADLSQPHPMLRLVQGDVGCGKTLVAALAALQAISNKKQVVLMAPTEILAEQHLKNFETWFAPLNISIGWLTGSLKAKERNKNLENIKNGNAQLVIGTHALFQDGVTYHDLALVIIDEQHRFGVRQRLALSEKGKTTGYEPHQLTMTATPIPRTLAMSVYADMDYSVIDELPPGRTPVNTVLIDNNRRDQVIDRVRSACQSGRQAYWVCTLIEESEENSLEEKQREAAEATAAMLTESLPEISVGLIHGRLKPAEKAEIMAAFKAGDIQLLVATTVIEVGVDVPNASLMIIENPEQLGLAQLHQLRGRIGRGSTESHCVLLYSPPLLGLGKERLAVMRETNDGFVIAEKDLQLRGPGEVLGTRQTGDIQFRIADLQRDEHLLVDVKKAATTLMQDYPEKIEPLIQRWLGSNALCGRV